MTYKVLTSPDFISALFGFMGTILVFFFGLPPRIDPEGHSHLILEGEDKNEIKKAKLYKGTSYLGLIFLAISFLVQLVVAISRL
jgi:hypothetical protein